jgi:hypothetical protein
VVIKLEQWDQRASPISLPLAETFVVHRTLVAQDTDRMFPKGGKIRKVANLPWFFSASARNDHFAQEWIAYTWQRFF